MGCQNGKQINIAKKSKKDLHRLLIEEITLLQRNILSTNMLYQVKTNMNNKTNFAKDNKNTNNLENSLTTNDNSINHDLNIAFIEQMRELQNKAKDLLTKAAFLIEQSSEDVLLKDYRFTLKQKIDCLYEFAFKLQLNAQPKPSDEDIKGLGDLCESVIIV